MPVLRSEVNPHGFTKMLERLGRDCSPLQYVREYVQNSIEAIQRAECDDGQILIDANWDLNDSAYKLSFTDNGIGMTWEEMQTHIKDLSSSGEENVFENYGMGAKIASITRNKAGISYESWKEDAGHFIFMKYDDVEDVYGLEQFSDNNGVYTHYCRVSSETKPDIINSHGTRVTLFGNQTDQDTMQPPKGATGARESWLLLYLNSRYYEIPQNVEIKVRIGYDRPRSDTKHNYLAIVQGQKSILEKHKISSGKVQVSDVTIHWWILNKERSGHSRERVIGHTAILHQNEIFNMTDGRSNRATLFGVIFGQKNVVLYIEPDSGKYVQNTTRTSLVDLQGNELPWEAWADEFRKNMPKQLNDYIQEIMNQAGQESHDKSIRERLKGVKDFFKISKYRPAPKGTFEADENSLVESSTGGVFGGRGSGAGKPGSNPGGTRSILASILEAGGIKAESVNPDPFPRVDWVSIEDGTRDEGEMEDRAACFLEKDNLIKANKNFQGFKDIIAYFIETYKHAPGYDSIVPDIIKELFEQQLIETVAGSLSLRGRRHWTPDHCKAALSEEALTAAVMSRYYLMQMARRMLNQKLSKPES